MINLLHEGYGQTIMFEDATVAGNPVIDSGNFLGIALISTDQVNVKRATGLAAALAGGGGYWPNGSYAFFAVTPVDANGKEGLPVFILPGPTGADDIIQLSWNAVTNAVSYNVYRGLKAAAAADVGSDLVFLTNVSTNACNDDGYSLTARGSAAAFEDVLIKGSSVRTPNAREAKTRLVENLLCPVIKRGVVELPIIVSASYGISSIAEGVNIQWDTATLEVTTQAVGGTRINIGKATLGYACSGVAKDKVAVSVNCLI